MDKKAFSDLEERLLEVNKIVAKLDTSIRGAAFEFLKPYVAGGTIKNPPQKDPDTDDNDEASSGGLTQLVTKFGSDEKPSDNAKLLTAYWFSQYGSAPFSIKWLKATCDSTGLTIPDSPAMTLRQAKEKGKNLYKALGKGGLFNPLS